MKEKIYTAACDLGASSGRVILGEFDGDHLISREVHRFENGYIDKSKVPSWDIKRIKNEVVKGLSVANQVCDGKLTVFGIDTWGVDYGLLDKDGQLLGDPRSYRCAVEEDMIPVFKKVPFPKIYQGTGIAAQSYNTLFQLYRRKEEKDPALENSRRLLMIPDLIAYLLTGEIGTEYTIATTSMMMDPVKKDWNRELLSELGLPAGILSDIQKSGTLRGELLPDIIETVGTKVKYAAVGSHDTASAVAAIPGRGNFAFLSSGTWSMLGIENEHFTMRDDLLQAGISNEGTIQGGFRLLKNIMGMWLIQECRKQWIRQGTNCSFSDISGWAAAETPFRSIIDPDYSGFFHAADLEEEIRNYCRKTGQSIPETRGQLARCIYESLALKYRWVLRFLENVKGIPADSINIVGGGIRNRLLNQMTADSTDRIVVAGPVECAADGNLLVQLMAIGEVKSLEELRDIVRRSEKTEVYEPHHNTAWDDAFDRLLTYQDKMKQGELYVTGK